MSDLINKDKLITVLEELENEYRMEDDFNSAFAIEYVTGKVKQQPSVDTERYANWVFKGKDIYGADWFKCSNCGREVKEHYNYTLLDEYPYCHCGCKMDKTHTL